jgi:ABC-type lipoprotein export system ATPase subunit
MSVQIQNLRKSYVGPDGGSVPVVDVARFDLADAEQVALIGTSGSGKTTFLHLIAGILAPDRGKILFTTDGQTTDVAQLSEAKRDVFRGRHVGYIFQTHHLLSGFTALENVMLGMSFSNRAPDRAWAEHVLEQVSLKDRLHYKPAKLSLGQQQRVAVARALANRPTLVLADEPTGSLDPRTAVGVLELIRSLCGEAGAALLMVTHDHDLAARLQRKVELSDINRAMPAEPAGVTA